MAYDYSQAQIPVFTGINDVVEAPSSTEGGNGGYYTQQINRIATNLNADLQALEDQIASLGSSGGSSEVHPVGVKLFLDTANGDDANDGSQTAPKATLQGAIDSLKGKLILFAEIAQNDTNTITLNAPLDLEGIEFAFHHALEFGYSIKELRFSNITAQITTDIIYWEFFTVGSDGKMDEPTDSVYRLFNKNSLTGGTVNFVSSDLTFAGFPVFDSCFNWQFENTTINYDFSYDNYGFVFQSNQLGSPHSFPTVYVYFYNCTFTKTGTDSGYPWSIDRGNYDITVKSCTFQSDFDSIFSLGTNSPNTGYPNHIHYRLAYNDYSGHSSGVFWWGDTTTHKEITVSQSLAIEFETYSGSDLSNLKGIEINQSDVTEFELQPKPTVPISSILLDAGGSNLATGSDSVDLADLNAKLNSLESKINAVITALKNFNIFS
jgi:hypothetical protein